MHKSDQPVYGAIDLHAQHCHHVLSKAGAQQPCYGYESRLDALPLLLPCTQVAAGCLADVAAL